ncbi:MAG: hypothetical protein V3U25_01260, partial [Nitrososphaerales archaeon]
MTSTSKFGTLGIDIGFFGRWIRLFYGGIILIPLLVQSAQDIIDGSLSFYATSYLYLLLIVAVYTVTYYVLGPRVLAKSGILNTIIFVGPAILTILWNPAVTKYTGMVLPSQFIFA